MSENYLQVLLAGVPTTPASKVIKIESNMDKIVVEMPLQSDNQGSTLLSYDLHADDGVQGTMETYYVGLNRTVDFDSVTL